MATDVAHEWRCSFCLSEVGAFELWDGRLIGFFCVKTALREAETQLIEGAYDEHVHPHLGELE